MTEATVPPTNGLPVDAAIWSATVDSTPSKSSRGAISPAPWPPAGVKPYYADDSVCILLGDCRDFLPLMPKVDLVLTDPPYGMNLHTGWARPLNSQGSSRVWEPVIGDDRPFDPRHLLDYPDQVIWGAQYFADKLPVKGGWFVFNKRGDGDVSGAGYGDCELAWTSRDQQSVRMFSHMWHGVARWTSEKVLHPTQKPVALMRWCLDFFPDAQTVLDPYMGSGTTLRAAKDLGRKAIGIEIEERYCEVAAKRMSQTVMAIHEVAG